MSDTPTVQASAAGTGEIPPIILTIDVEEWFHAHNYMDRLGDSSWQSHELRARRGMEPILQLCEELGIRATFFILGWLARREKALVAEIAAAGHEIGCHSHSHPVIYDMQPEEFREDCRQGRDVLGEILGKAPVLYRAPSFTITPRSYWALEILREEGFRVDSSLFPVSHPRYGNPRGPRTPFCLGPQEDSLLVIPMTTLKIPCRNLPFSGGGYFRLFPMALLKACSNWTRKVQREPVFFYIHPWELDSFRPQEDLGWLQNLRSQGGKKDLHEKLRRFLQGQSTLTLGEWAQELQGKVKILATVDEIKH